MTLDEYQLQAITTELMKRADPLTAHDPAFMAKLLGLVGEAGEVAEKFKKIIRDHEGHITDDDKSEIIKELGDVLWYVSALTSYLDTSLEHVAQANLDKLFSRRKRGTSHGSGDNR